VAVGKVAGTFAVRSRAPDTPYCQQVLSNSTTTDGLDECLRVDLLKLMPDFASQSRKVHSI